jgi:hypothetical protein
MENILFWRKKPVQDASLEVKTAEEKTKESLALEN